MFRLLVKLLVFTVVVALSLYIGAQWKLTEELKRLDSQLGSDIQFYFEKAHLTLLGKVVVSGVSLSFTQQDLSITANKVEYSAGSIVDMVFLSDHFQKKVLFDQIEISLSEVVIPLTPTLVKFISSNEEYTVFDFLEALGCGSKKKLDINDYVKMGYDYAVFSAEFQFNRDPLDRDLIGEGWLNLEDDSNIEFKIGLAGVSKSVPNLGSFEVPTIKYLDLRFEDKGYNFRKNTYCSAFSKSSNEKYLNKHIESLKQTLGSIGIELTPQGAIAYKELLQPNRVVQFRVEPEASFSFNSFGYYDEKDLRSLLNLDLNINSRPVPLVFNDWALDKIDRIEINEKIEVQNKKGRRFETISVKRFFHQESLGKARDYFDYKVKVISNNGKTMMGSLKKIKKNKFYIETSMTGGTIQRTIKTEEIKQFFVYR